MESKEDFYLRHKKRFRDQAKAASYQFLLEQMYITLRQGKVMRSDLGALQVRISENKKMFKCLQSLLQEYK